VKGNVCNISDCGDPSPVSGSANTSTFTYGSFVGITCDDGFTINGNSEIQCQPDGTWSDNPTCDPSGTVALICRLTMQFFSLT
jgi:hypothetical protein